MRPTTARRSSPAHCADLAYASAETPHAGADRRGWADVGCADESLVIAGRGHPPQEVEEIAGSSHPALRSGHAAAFVVRAGDGQALLVACEMRERVPRTVRAADVVHAVRAALASERGIHSAHVLLLRPSALRTVPWGMTRRRACRERLLDGALRGATWTDGHDARRRCADLPSCADAAPSPPVAHRRRPDACAARAD